jgi:preprotein translocase subunit SecG
MEMLNLISLLVPTTTDASYNLYLALSFVMIVLMFLAAVVAIVLVLLQPSNSRGVSALGGSSETFFGKNKGKSIEERMKKWTIICLAVLVVFSVCFYVIQIDALW